LTPLMPYEVGLERPGGGNLSFEALAAPAGVATLGWR